MRWIYLEARSPSAALVPRHSMRDMWYRIEPQSEMHRACATNVLATLRVALSDHGERVGEISAELVELVTALRRTDELPKIGIMYASHDLLQDEEMQRAREQGNTRDVTVQLHTDQGEQDEHTLEVAACSNYEGRRDEARACLWYAVELTSELRAAECRVAAVACWLTLSCRKVDRAWALQLQLELVCRTQASNGDAMLQRSPLCEAVRLLPDSHNSGLGYQISKLFSQKGLQALLVNESSSERESVVSAAPIVPFEVMHNETGTLFLRRVPAEDGTDEEEVTQITQAGQLYRLLDVYTVNDSSGAGKTVQVLQLRIGPNVLPGMDIEDGSYEEKVAQLSSTDLLNVNSFSSWLFNATSARMLLATNKIDAVRGVISCLMHDWCSEGNTIAKQVDRFGRQSGSRLFMFQNTAMNASLETLQLHGHAVFESLSKYNIRINEHVACSSHTAGGMGYSNMSEVPAINMQHFTAEQALQQLRLVFNAVYDRHPVDGYACQGMFATAVLTAPNDDVFASLLDDSMVLVMQGYVLT